MAYVSYVYGTRIRCMVIHVIHMAMCKKYSQKYIHIYTHKYIYIYTYHIYHTYSHIYDIHSHVCHIFGHINHKYDQTYHMCGIYMCWAYISYMQPYTHIMPYDVKSHIYVKYGDMSNHIYIYIYISHIHIYIYIYMYIFIYGHTYEKCSHIHDVY